LLSLFGPEGFSVLLGQFGPVGALGFGFGADDEFFIILKI